MDTPANLLERFVATVDSLDARFVQETLDDNGQPIEFETTTGRFQLLRPDRFLLHQEPPIELKVVSDGNLVWNYDVGLEQADCAPFSEYAASPVMLLIGEEALGDDFRVSELEPVAGRSRLELRPVVEADSDFVSATVTFDGDVPVLFEWTGPLEQSSRIEFTNVTVNPELDADTFVFRPPDGVLNTCREI